MKRTPIQRKTPLQSTTPLQARHALTRKTPLVARSGPKRTPYRAPRPSVTPAERRARKLVRARSAGTCELCGIRPATNFQHRRPKSGQGTWCPTNGLDVCGFGNASGCHGRIHQNPAEAYRMGWSVRRNHDPATQPVWLHGHGWSFLLADGSVEAVTDIPDEESA